MCVDTWCHHWVPFKNIFQIKLLDQSFFYGRSSSECGEFLPQCEQLMAFSRPSSKYKTYNINLKLCLLGDLNNEHAERSSLPMNNHLKTVIWVKLAYWLKALSPGRLEQWTCRIFPSVLMNSLFKIISQVNLLYRLKICVRGDLNSEHADTYLVSPKNGPPETSSE